MNISKLRWEKISKKYNKRAFSLIEFLKIGWPDLNYDLYVHKVHKEHYLIAYQGEIEPDYLQACMIKSRRFYENMPDEDNFERNDKYYVRIVREVNDIVTSRIESLTTN